MDDADFQSKLHNLMQQISALPSPQREVLESVAKNTAERNARMKKTVQELQDSLDYLRLATKYLVFDLEATRRENQYLRKLLNARNGSTQDGNSG